MNQKVTNKYLSGTAIIAVPQEEIETILKHNFHCFKDVAKPREETHVFMHRFFEYLKKKKQITRSSKICLIIPTFPKCLSSTSSNGVKFICAIFFLFMCEDK